MLAMIPVPEEGRTGSPWRTVLWALVGPDLLQNLYVTLAPGLPSSSSGFLLFLLFFPISGIGCHSPFLLLPTHPLPPYFLC